MQVYVRLLATSKRSETKEAERGCRNKDIKGKLWGKNKQETLVRIVCLSVREMWMAAFNLRWLIKVKSKKVHSVWMKIKGKDKEIAEAQRDKVREEKWERKYMMIYWNLFKPWWICILYILHFSSLYSLRAVRWYFSLWLRPLLTLWLAFTLWWGFDLKWFQKCRAEGKDKSSG